MKYTIRQGKLKIEQPVGENDILETTSTLASRKAEIWKWITGYFCNHAFRE